MQIKPISRKENIVVQELEKELLVYDLQTNKAFCLNETSAIIYQLSDGQRTVSEIADLMSVKLQTLVSEDFVWLALNELKRDGLLENAAEMKEYFAGMNRREIVKKIGFATMIALPIVSSVVAPSAAMAASGGAALFATCTANPDCASGACRPCAAGTTPCPSFNWCCVSTAGNSAPGRVTDGCRPIGGCPIDAGECCSGIIVTGPNLCGFPGREACICG